MFEIMFKLIMAMCLFGISLTGITIASAMWRKSANLCKCICKECECCN